MASSGEDTSSKDVQGIAGELVWVLRRYGTWWPAQILDPDQLPDGSFRKPGLPFKLLGREEDPIVEWYNLEKSKRVKAFRCGKFDDYIEKAKAAAVNLTISKNPSRYARKDDAILQALELENASLALDHPKFSANSGAKDEDHYDVDISSSSFHSSEHSENASRRTNDAQKGDEISSFPGVQMESFVMLFNVPLIPGENNSAGVSEIAHGASSKTQVSAAAPSSQSSHANAISFGDEEPNESYSTSFGIRDVHRGSQWMEKSITSEWQLKGKRNCRSRKMGINGKAETHKAATDRGRLLPGCSRNMDPSRIHGSLITDSDGYLVKSRSMKEIQTAEHLGWNWNAHNRESHERGSTAEMAAPKRKLPHRHSRLMLNPKYDSGEFSLSHHAVDAVLYDVTVRVEANHQPQGVPYISLVSKIYSRSITGHPLTVEVLDDGSCDDQLEVSHLYSSSSKMENKFGKASSAQGGDLVYGRRPRGRPPRNYNWSQGQCSMAKPEKKGHSPKKFRKLSSLTDSYGKNQQQELKPLVEKIKAPSVACVPLAVVFSRLNADLNQAMRPPRRFN